MVEKDNYLKSDLTVQDNMVDSRAINHLKHYLEMFKTKIIHGRE